MAQGLNAPRQGLSIVCVYNNVDVRVECLDRSVNAYSGDLDVDYIPVDNATHAFTTAGAALNHGARLARHELVVFVHQDVYLHSIDRLMAVGQALEDGSWGVLGANGVTSSGLNVGRLRDRTQLIGVSAPVPVEVDSLDEVLFMVPRAQLLEHPLSEADDVAWHAYAVEYSARLRLMGVRPGAVDLAITHNSLTINLAKLDAAHRSVGRLYSQLVPIHTTCGTIAGRASWLRANPLIRRHGWRLRWLRQSLLAARVRRRLNTPVVFSDIRHDVDRLPLNPGSRLQVINVDPTGGFVKYGREPLDLTRYGRPLVMRAVASIGEAGDLVARLPPDQIVLVVGVSLDDLGQATWVTQTDRQWVLGIHPGEMWLLGGLRLDQLPGEWSRPEAVPLAAGAAIHQG